MNDTPHFWPEGIGQWNRLARLVLGDDVKAVNDEGAPRNATFLGTPLELIAELERCKQHGTATVILAGQFASDDFASALRDIYPGIDVIISTP